jgi:hypothetical protein
LIETRRSKLWATVTAAKIETAAVTTARPTITAKPAVTFL